MTETIRITTSSILEDLKNGLTRTTSTLGYKSEIGSIEEKYGLNKTEVKELFKHPKLIGKKTIFPKETRFELIDDLETNEPISNISENEQVTISASNENITSDLVVNNENNNESPRETVEETENISPLDYFN